MTLTSLMPLLTTANETKEANFAQFLSTYQPEALRLAYRWTGGDRSMAHDIVQDAFIKAYRKWQSIDDQTKRQAWFMRIVLNTARDHYRREQRQARLYALFSFSPTHKDEQNERDPVLGQQIALAIRTLSPRQRDAFILVYFEEHSIQDAASILKITSGTLKKHLHRAVHSLRRALRHVKGEIS
jgi:RNA polymerase sigma-70 factor, ECF subfamily